ncbi:hypothetical protein [Streptomyces sp. NPDC101166]|uniref:hypothetical protein n=1 Tax=Streptomyces sp. NPDC101166 TaxID=3366120 RepID=UPI00382ECF62
MSESQVVDFDPTFVALFRHATPDAVPRVAERIGAQARLSVLGQNRYAPPACLGDWVAAQGTAEEVQALYTTWGLSARQSRLLVERDDLLDDLDAGLVGMLAAAGPQALPSAAVERQWRATPAGRFRNPGVFGSDAPLPEVEERVRARLGSDERAWETAFDLLAGGFPEDLPTLLEAALRYDSTVPEPCRHVDPGAHVSWLARIAPGDLPQRLLGRLDSWSLRRAVSGNQRVPLAPLIAAMDSPGLWQSMLGRLPDASGFGASADAQVMTAFLQRDDPRLNAWLLIDATHPELRLAPATRLALLEGRPFGTKAQYPLPRTDAVRARVAFEPPTAWDDDLLRLCYDSREPGLAAQALRAAWQDDGEVLTPYQQLVAGIRLWAAGRSDVLTSLMSHSAAGVRAKDVEDAFTEALRQHSVNPLYAAARHRGQRGDEHLDEALRIWRQRVPTSLRASDLYRLPQNELAAVSRAITGDRWYDVDWDLVRRRLDAPRAKAHRRRIRERYGVLLARGDCPADVVRILAGTDLTPLELLRIFSDRDAAISALSTRCLATWTPEFGTGLPRVVVQAAVPQPDWHPAVTVEDVIRHARPAEGVIQHAGSDAVGRVVAETLEEIRSSRESLDETELWVQLLRVVRHCTAPAPGLLRLAAELTAGGKTVDVLPAAEFLVRPESADLADEVRQRLDVLPERWTRALRLLTAGFEGPLPALLDAARRHEEELPIPPGRSPADHCAPALLLELAPAAVIETVVARLDPPLCVLLARSSSSADVVCALVRRGDRQVWDTLLSGTRVPSPLHRAGETSRFDWARTRDETLIPALLAQNDPELNARLVREHFGWSHYAERIRAILSGTSFGPSPDPVPVAPDLIADFADWTPVSGRKLPPWTVNEGFWDFPEPVLAFQALMAVRQTNYQDPPSTTLALRQSLTAATTIAAAGRFDLLRHAVDHWHIRYPWGDHLDERALFEEAVNLRSPAPLEARLEELG